VKLYLEVACPLNKPNVTQIVVMYRRGKNLLNHQYVFPSSLFFFEETPGKCSVTHIIKPIPMPINIAISKEKKTKKLEKTKKTLTVSYQKHR